MFGGGVREDGQSAGTCYGLNRVALNSTVEHELAGSILDAITEMQSFARPVDLKRYGGMVIQTEKYCTGNVQCAVGTVRF